MPESIFTKFGLNCVVDHLLEEICQLYQQDNIPWIIGYSGGKDSSAVLQLIWMALKQIPLKLRKKSVHVISTDTMVENPIVNLWVSHSLELINTSAKKQNLPIEAYRLTPHINDSFWVNLLGRGYPSPRNKFRWCTVRLKIKPSTHFIKQITKNSGHSLLILGTRKTESFTRAKVMEKYEQLRIQDRISPNGDLANSNIYTPIEDWTNDDVWMFLMQKKNLWGIEHNDLMGMYRGASADGECPLILDTTAPSCGSSRFGCWVCTFVSEDRSMSAMIQNDEEKYWMEPLLLFRNKLAEKDDRHLRDFRRMNGQVQLFSSSDAQVKLIPGPYKKQTRENWLRELLLIQMRIKKDDKIPEAAKINDLITIEELKLIRRLWVYEKHEIEDTLPGIYKEVTGESFPDCEELNGFLPYNGEVYNLLQQSCDHKEMHYNLVRELLSIEARNKLNIRRSNIYNDIEKAFERGFYADDTDAFEFSKEQFVKKRFINENDDIDSLLKFVAELMENQG